MSLAASPALAQDRAPVAAPPIPIVLVDIQLSIFKEHAVFKAEMSQLHDDLNRAHAEAKKESLAIQNISPRALKELTTLAATTTSGARGCYPAV